MARSEFIFGNKIIDQLIESGIADRNTQRVIIDIPIDGFPILYVQKMGTNKLIDLIALLGGAKIGDIITHTKVVTFEKPEVNEPE